MPTADPVQVVTAAALLGDLDRRLPDRDLHRFPSPTEGEDGTLHIPDHRETDDLPTYGVGVGASTHGGEHA